MGHGLHSRSGIAAGLVSLAASAAAGTTGRASPNPDELSRAIRAEVGPLASLLTPDERRLVAGTCGERALDPGLRGISIDNEVMTCPDGREVRGPAIRALADRVGRRAGARAEAAMRSPRVRAAMHGIEDEALRRATAEIER